MTWQLTWGEREDGLQEVYKTTGKIPNALLSKPKLDKWVIWYWNAFWMLDSGRPIYQGSVGRIPLGEMFAYISIFEVRDPEAKHLFVTMIRALDSVYVRMTNERIQREVAMQRKQDEENRINGRG